MRTLALSQHGDILLAAPQSRCGQTIFDQPGTNGPDEKACRISCSSMGDFELPAVFLSWHPARPKLTLANSPVCYRRIVAMHPVAQRLPIHAILLRRFGARTALQYQRDRQNAAHLRAIATLAGETPKLRRRPVQASDWDRRAHPMPPWARIAPGLSNRTAEGFGTPESQRQRGLVLIHDLFDSRPQYNHIFKYFETVKCVGSMHLLKVRRDVKLVGAVTDLLRFQFCPD